MTFKSFNYDGTNMLIMGIRLLERPIVSQPKVTEIVQNIPGMVGELYMGSDIGSRTISLKVALLCKSEEELNSRKLYLDNLITQHKAMEFPLVLDEDSLWTYFGHFAGRTDYESTGAINEVITTLTFNCSDPYKYGRQIDRVIVGNTLKFTPDGQQSTYPIFSAIAKKDATWCGLTTPEQFVYVGGKVNIETGEVATTLYNPVLTDTAQNMALWQRQSSETFTQIDNGTVGKGSYFKQATDDINVKDFGTNEGKSTGWYGPALKRMMTKQLSNWKVTFRVQSMNNYKRAENKLELYLLDSSGKAVGKLSIKDNGEGSEQEINIQVYQGNGAVKSVGSFKPTVKNKKSVALAKKQKVAKTDSKGKVTYTYVTLKETLNENNSTNDFTDFYGNITLEKVGNQFYAEVVKLDTKTRNEIGNWSAMWTDEYDTFKSDVAGFVVFAGKRAIEEDKQGISYKANYLAFCDLKVFERTEIKQDTIISTSPEVIIWAGDEIVFDGEKARIYKNGQLFLDGSHIGLDYIELIGGVQTEIVFADGFDWTMHYRPTAF